MKEPLILVGGGGHCRACIDVIELDGRYEIAGIVDLEANIGTEVLGYRVIACDEDLEKLTKIYKNFFISLGHLNSNVLRKKIARKLESLDITFPTIISPRAYVAKGVKLGLGTIVMHDVMLNSGATIGDHCIINSKALVEHDATVGNDSHISTAAVLNGGVRVGKNCFVGSGSVLKQYITISDSVNLGAAALVLNDIVEAGQYFGSPVKNINKSDNET